MSTPAKKPRIGYWITVGLLAALVSVLFIERASREFLYWQALYRSYQITSSYYEIEGGFDAFKQQYEADQGQTLLQFDPLYTDPYDRKFYIPRLTGHGYGFMQPEPSPEPREETFRVLCVGTSTVEAGFPSQLQAILDERAPGRYEVINAGIPGASTQNLIMNYLSLWAGLQSHYVIIEHNVDAVTLNGTVPYILDETFDEPQTGGTKAQIEAAYLEDSGIAFLDLVRFNIKYVLNSGVRRGQVDNEGLLRYRAFVEQLIRLIRGNGAQPMLVTYQASLSLDDDRDNAYSPTQMTRILAYYQAFFFTHTVRGTLRVLAAQNEALRELAARLDVPIVDIDGMVPRQDDSYIDGTHYGDTANRIIATAIADKLLATPPPRPAGPSEMGAATATPGSIHRSPAPSRTPARPPARGEGGYEYDVVIAGAGLAGLAAAYELRGYRVLLLEKNARAGGRVLTGRHGDIVYELGGSHAWTHDAVPFSFDTPPVELVEGPVGLSLNGRVVWCQEPEDCIQQLAVPQAVKDEVIAFGRGQMDDPDALSETSLELLNALYMAEHPDDIRRALREIRHAAFEFFPGDYRPAGNDKLVAAFLDRIDAEVRYGAEVVKVESADGGARVLYRADGAEHEVRARYAISAVQGPVASEIVAFDSKELEQSIATVQYHQISVAVLGLRDLPLESWNYVIPVGLKSSLILRNLSSDPSTAVLRVYFGHNMYNEIAAMDDAAVVALAMEMVRRAGIADVRDEQLAFSHVHRWKYGTVKRPMRLPKGSPPASFLAAPKIAVAGDFLCPIIGIGMDCAMKSGRGAGAYVKSQLDQRR